jgi:hypothetical protein
MSTLAKARQSKFVANGDFVDKDLTENGNWETGVI